MLAHGNRVFVLGTIIILNHDNPFALHNRTESNDSLNLSQHGRGLGSSCFEQLTDTWQTTSNIFGLHALFENLSKNAALFHFCAVFHTEIRCSWEEVDR